jgi:hypothetical protein
VALGLLDFTRLVCHGSAPRRPKPKCATGRDTNCTVGFRQAGTQSRPKSAATRQRTRIKAEHVAESFEVPDAILDGGRVGAATLDAIDDPNRPA